MVCTHKRFSLRMHRPRARVMRVMKASSINMLLSEIRVSIQSSWLVFCNLHMLCRKGSPRISVCEICVNENSWLEIRGLAPSNAVNAINIMHNYTAYEASSDKKIHSDIFDIYSLQWQKFTIVRSDFWQSNPTIHSSHTRCWSCFPFMALVKENWELFCYGACYTK